MPLSILINFQQSLSGLIWGLFIPFVVEVIFS